MRNKCTALLAIFFMSAISAMAQASVSSAELKGTVIDPTGAVVPGATLAITNPETGIRRTVVTNDNGEYQVLRLPPGTYEVMAEATGFASQVKKGMQVTVGQIAVLDFQLDVGVTTEVIEVTTDLQLIETERTQQSNTIQERYVQNLPIDRRDYLSFSLLAPGVVDSDAFSDNTDFRVAQTPQSGLSFYGSNGRGNSITVDGGEANDESGGVRPTVSQEAVQEFQVNRSNYTAEFGGASGGVINIVTKSGGNEFRGSIFGFFRDDSLDAADPFAVGLVNDRPTRIDPPSNRQQYGGSLSFPIQKDKTFLFGAFEKLNRDESAAVPVLTDFSIFEPTAEQTAILDSLAADPSLTPIECIGSAPPFISLPPAACGQFLRGLLTVETPEVIDLFRRNTGVFPFVANNTMWSVRLDHQFSLNDQFTFRYNFAENKDRNQNLSALVAFSRGNAIKQFDSNAIASWTHTFSPTMINELQLQWNYNTFDVIANDPAGPEISIAGFGFFNRDIFLPSFTTARRYQVSDNLSYSRGNHTLKFGGLILIHRNVTESHTFFGGRFNFGPLPGFIVGPPLAATSVNGLQAFDLGAPQFYQQGFGNPTVSATLPFYAFYGQDSWKAAPNFTFNFGLRYELDDRRDPLPTDTNNLGPRVGFAWDPFKDGKTTIRGGYGIYYAPIYFQIDYVVNALNSIGSNNFRQIAQIFVPLTGAPVINPQTNAPLTSADIFGTLRAQGVIGVPDPDRTITPADLTQFGVNITNDGPIPPLTVLFNNSDDYVNAYSQQASFGIEREISDNWSLALNYIFSRTLKITRARDANIATCCPATFFNPLLLQGNVYESTGRAFYHGFIVEVNKRFSHNFSLSANYTLSKAIDEVTDFNSDFQASDQTNLRAERSLSAFDQRHKFVIYAVLQSPYRGGSGVHPLKRFLSGFALTPIFRANSARPFNLLAGADLNADRHSTTDRPSTAGRNIGRGPNFWTFDVRLARRIGLGSERRTIELTFEAFNLFNRLNFASLNNTVGVIEPPFELKGRKDRSPSEPLGFTSAFEPRRIQLGFRLSF